MKLAPPSDIWRVGVLPIPLEQAAFLPPSAWPAPLAWIASPKPFTFLADPFGIARDGRVYVFVERYDYRDKTGHIEVITLSETSEILAQETALKEPWHLSYPFVFEDAGDCYMLPEAHRSGRLTLYRAERFPDRWKPVQVLAEQPMIDATLLQHDGLWWLFYCLPDAPTGALHVAYSKTLLGHWQAHPLNPVMEGADRVRPGGKPFIKDGAMYLPVQDCRDGYGAALNMLRIERLSRTEFAASVAHSIAPGAWSQPFGDGLHTLSGSGNVTLFDVKRIHRSPARHLVNWQRRLQRYHILNNGLNGG